VGWDKLRWGGGKTLAECRNCAKHEDGDDNGNLRGFKKTSLGGMPRWGV